MRSSTVSTWLSSRRLALDEIADRPHVPEVLELDLRGREVDPERLVQKGHDLEDAQGIHDAGFDERLVVVQAREVEIGVDLGDDELFDSCVQIAHVDCTRYG